MVFSPPYACHVVVVATLIIVFSARSGESGVVWKLEKNHGKKCCSLRMAYKMSVQKRPKNTKLVAYSENVISTAGSVPVMRYISRSIGRQKRSSGVRFRAKTRPRYPPNAFTNMVPRI